MEERGTDSGGVGIQEEVSDSRGSYTNMVGGESREEATGLTCSESGPPTSHGTLQNSRESVIGSGKWYGYDFRRAKEEENRRSKREIRQEDEGGSQAEKIQDGRGESDVRRRNGGESGGSASNVAEWIGDRGESAYKSAFEVYTFIAKPHEQRPDEWKPKGKGATRPCYIYFNHGDHIHVLFVSQPNNKQRTARVICGDLNLLDTERFRALNTLRGKLVTIHKFVNYLVRYGIGTYHVVGKRVASHHKVFGEIQTYLDEMRDTEPDLRDTDCQQYCESENQKKKEGKARAMVTTCGEQRQVLWPLIQEGDVKDIDDLKRKISIDEQLEFFSRWGPTWEKNAECLIKLFKGKVIEDIKKRHYFDVISDNMGGFILKEEEKNWIMNLFVQNNINFVEFIAKFIVVREKQIEKLNSFAICGPTNCGKSMVIKWLTDVLQGETLIKQNDMNQFYFSKITNASSVIMEEPIIWGQNVNIYKTLLGGESHTTDRKYSDHKEIPRTPFFITTNENELGSKCSDVDRNALASRSYHFHMQQQIKNNRNIGAGISPAPVTIEDRALHTLVLKYRKLIEAEVNKLISGHYGRRDHGDSEERRRTPHGQHNRSHKKEVERKRLIEGKRS